MHNTVKGILCVVLGTLLISGIPVVSKLVLEQMPSLHFSALWMSTALMYVTIWIVGTGPRRTWQRLRPRLGAVVLTGLVAAVWVYSYFRGLKVLHPAVVTFVMNSRTVWAILGGVLILRERYRPLQLVGMVIVVAGLVMVFADTRRSAELVGVLLVLVAAISYSAVNMLVRTYVHDTGVKVTLLTRFFFPVLLLVPIARIQGPFAPYVNWYTGLLIAGGAFVGPFLSFLLLYTALRYLQVGVHSLFQAVGVVYTTVFAYLALGSLPPTNRIIGGGIILAGLVITSIGSIRSRRNQTLTEPSVSETAASPSLEPPKD